MLGRFSNSAGETPPGTAGQWPALHFLGGVTFFGGLVWPRYIF